MGRMRQKLAWATVGALAAATLAIAAALVFLVAPAGRAKSLSPVARAPSLPAALKNYERTGGFAFAPGTGAIDIALGPKGLYVTCARGYQVWTFDGLSAPAGAAPAKAQSVSTPTQPWGLAVDADGTVYLGMDRHIEVRDGEGAVAREWAELGRNTRIQGIAADAQFVYAADGQEKCVYQFTKQGRLIRRIGDKNAAAGVPAFVVPGIHFDLLSTNAAEATLIVVSNPGRHSVEYFRPDGTLVSLWTHTGDDWDGFAGCCNPGSIAFLRQGAGGVPVDLLFTAEKGIPRVKAYRLDGRLESVVEGPEDFLPDVDGVEIAVAPDGRVLVLDPDRQELRVFSRLRRAGP
jgi:hypothetical protein